MGREEGLREEQLRDLASYQTSPEFDALEKLILDLALGMTRTPVAVEDRIVKDLRVHFDDAQLVELTATIAWENWRARFNHALGIEAHGFNEGAYCPIPELPQS